MKKQPSEIWTVAVPLPVKGIYSYRPPAGRYEKPVVGCRAVVPFGSRRVRGYIIGQSLSHLWEDLKEIEKILDPEPLFPEHMVPFFEWVAEYYLCPIGMVIQSALPERMGAASYKNASITEKGLEALQDTSLSQKDMEILRWVRDNPGRRLKYPFPAIFPFQRKGLLTLEENLGGKRSGHLTRKFVRCRKDVDMDLILKEAEGSLKAENEEEFLKEILDSSSVQLSEINKRFRNGSYLVQKWCRKGALETHDETVFRDPVGRIISQWPVPEALFSQQDLALRKIKAGLKGRKFYPCLLHGVTGSGKTEVYLRAAEYAVSLGRRVLVMIPEISLAVYMESVFRHRLNASIGIYHSGLSAGERHDQWVRMNRGEIDVVIGARSALFCPVRDLGLVIVDEEHDLAYKQENNPRYQARDAAVVRAKMEQAVILLGSGTPSVQSYFNGISGKYHVLEMPERVESRPMPQVEVVDMKALREEGGMNKMLTPALIQAVRKNLEAGNQTILFLNRRGFHRLFLCRTCGKSIRCPNCEVTLTHHHNENRLACHYCGYSSKVYMHCPSCKRGRLKPYGFGTEKLEHELAELFPGVRSARMDTDSVRKKGQAYRILKRFSNKDIDILVGTQMITKGYDFPGVTLVGIVAADLSLEFPDFRGGERTFQILSQVAGRAGRGEKPGKVLIQTFNPEHYAVKMAIAHDYKGFFENEINLRKKLGYPPFSHLACLRLQARSKQRTERTASELGSRIRERLKCPPFVGKGIQVLGPAEAPIPRIKDRYRWQVLIKSPDSALLRSLLEEVHGLSKKWGGSRSGKDKVLISFDVDPYNMI